MESRMGSSMKSKMESAFWKKTIRQVPFFAFMYLLGAVCIVFEPWNGSRFIGLLELFFDLTIVCAVIALLPKVVGVIARTIVAVVLYSVSLVDMFCYDRLHSPITASLFQVFRQTDDREASEAMASYLDGSVLLTPISLILGVLILHIVATILLHKYHDCVVIRLQKVSKKWKMAALITFLTIFLVCGYMCRVNKEYLYNRIVLGLTETETQRKKDLDPPSKFYLPIYRLAIAYVENHHEREALTRLEEVSRSVHVDSCSFNCPNIVVIIGESYNRHHSQLYGYGKPTTPFLCKRQRAGELVAFSDVISSWNLTCQSFQNMFSMQVVGDTGKWYDEPLFTELYKKAGYNVMLISNQFVMNLSKTFSDFGEDLFMNTPKLSQAQFNYRNKEIHDYDGKLLDDYTSLKSKLRKYNLTLFHFMGLHADFSERYPKSWNKFGVNDYEYRKDLNQEEKQVLASYDNAVRYNDYVVEQILKQFEHQDAIVIFVPDHGERVYDHSTEFGRSLSFDRNSVIQQYEIPFWIWTSKSYRNRHPLSWQAIGLAKDKPFVTDRLSQMLIGIAGIHCKSYNPARDLLQHNYDTKLPRIIGGAKDFDQIMKKSK